MRSVIVLVAGLLLAMTGCTSQESEASGEPSSEIISASSDTTTTQALPGEASPGPVAATEPQETEEPGSIGSKELPPVDVAEDVELDAGIGVRVTAISDVQIEAQGPGEVSGPGLAVQVEITNDSQDPLNLSGIAVSLSLGSQPGIPSFSAPNDPFVGELAPGGQATATYAFLKPEGSTGESIVRVEYNGSNNVVVVVQ